MQMRHGVARDVANVEHEAVPVGHQPLPSCHLLGRDEQIGDVRGVLATHVVSGGDVSPGYDEHMGGRLGVEVTERVAALGRRDLRRRDGAAHDAAEQAVVAHIPTVAVRTVGHAG